MSNYEMHNAYDHGYRHASGINEEQKGKKTETDINAT